MEEDDSGSGDASGGEGRARQNAAQQQAAQMEELRKARQAELQVRHEEAVLRRELAGEMGPTFTPPPVQVILPPPPLPDLPAVENVVRAEDGTTAYMRKGSIDFIAFDKKLLCAAIAEGKVPVDCVEVVKGELRKFVKGEQKAKREAVIPGVEIVEKDKLVVQTGGR